MQKLLMVNRKTDGNFASSTTRQYRFGVQGILFFAVLSSPSRQCLNFLDYSAPPTPRSWPDELLPCARCGWYRHIMSRKRRGTEKHSDHKFEILVSSDASLLVYHEQTAVLAKCILPDELNQVLFTAHDLHGHFGDVGFGSWSVAKRVGYHAPEAGYTAVGDCR